MRTFITALKSMKIGEDLGRGDKIESDILITNNKEVINSFISRDFIKIAGILESNFILNSSAVIYKEEKSDRMSKGGIEDLDKFNSKIKLFQTCLWLIKDNSAYTELGYCITKKKTEIKIDSNFLTSIYTNADGNKRTTDFTREELRQARNIFNNIEDIVQYEVSFAAKKQGLNRIERALFYVQIARSNDDLSLKISEYCSALESLLSTNPNEIAHQLSERVAILIGQNKSDRIQIYREIKKAYGIRSKIVHGDKIPDNQIKDIRQLSRNLDSYLRLVILKISDDEFWPIFNSDKQEIDNYFLNQIFEMQLISGEEKDEG